eukprot:Clim_evm7s231 gene=Clim_evmTU7s231
MVKFECGRNGCSNEGKMQCPICVKNGLPPARFCTQDCFKKTWTVHKLIHQAAGIGTNGKSANGEYDPYPGFEYSGELRPFPRRMEHNKVKNGVQKPDYAVHGQPISEQRAKSQTQIKQLTAEEIKGMEHVCELAREVLDIAVEMAKPGVTCEEIDDAVHAACMERDAYPSPLNYYEFPKSCCTSLNEVICHGIPDSRPLKEGDILNIDITLYKGGFHGDLNDTIFIGKPSDDALRLVKTARECLDRAIAACKPGMRYRDIGNIIQKHASFNDTSVVRTYCGHGIHQLFHTFPNVPHYGKNKAVGIMQPGHCFTIEPMINLGTWRDMLWRDGWTSTTTDGKLSAQFEETLLVTETGVRILTKRRSGSCRPYFYDQLDDLGITYEPDTGVGAPTINNCEN